MPEEKKVAEWDGDDHYDGGSVYGGGDDEEDPDAHLDPDPDAGSSGVGADEGRPAEGEVKDEESKPKPKQRNCPKCHGRRYIARRPDGSMIWCPKCVNVSKTMAGVMYELRKAAKEALKEASA